MTRWSKVTARIVASAAALVLLAGCGAGGRPDDGAAQADNDPNAKVGLTDTTIKLGGHYPLTGVAAPGYSEIPDGINAYFDYVNAAGGIHGRKLEFIVKDDVYNPTNTSNVVRELVTREQVFALFGGLGTPTHNAVVDYLNEEKVPDLMVSSGSQAWGTEPKKRPMTFGWQPDYVIEAKVIGSWIKENKPDAKVAVFAQDDDLGADGEQGLRQQLGDQVVAVAKYTPGNTDVAPQIAQLQAAKPDIVVGFNVPSYTALSQLVSKRLNFTPQWIYTNVGADKTLVGGLLERFSEGKVKAAGGSALDGVMTTQYIPNLENSDDPWTQLWQKVWKEHGNGKPLSNYKIYGMSQAYALAQVLHATGQDLTRAGVVKTLEQQGASLEGPQLSPFRYSADSHLGIGGVRMIELGPDGSKQLTKVRVTDTADGPVTDSDEKHATPPASGIPGS